MYHRWMQVFIALLAWQATATAEPPALDPAQFPKLLRVIKPDQQLEKWQQIPWQTNLWEARQQAARDGKPILLWEMDGHPLGCV